jgi:hypothetical protein
MDLGRNGKLNRDLYVQILGIDSKDFESSKPKFESFQKPEIWNLIKDSNQEILKYQTKDNMNSNKEIKSSFWKIDSRRV